MLTYHQRVARVLYGRFVIRARIPASQGSWPAIWMLGSKKEYGWPSCGENVNPRIKPSANLPSNAVSWRLCFE